MSRSYRKPYGTWCSIKRSAHLDKQMAARAVRRKQNTWLRNHGNDEGGLIPHRYECRHNDVYGWGRDGRQFLMLPTHRDWDHHIQAVEGWGFWAGDVRYMVWPPEWYRDIVRK